MGRKSKAAQGAQHRPASSDGAAGASAGKGKQEDSQLWTALKHEDEEELRELLFDELVDPETGAVSLTLRPTARKLVNQPNAKKLYPLSFAVAEGLSPTIVQFLLHAGAQVNKKDDTAKMLTALHAACWNEDDEAVLTLLRAGADPRVGDADGRTPLHVLATSNAVALVSLVLNQVARTDIGDGAGADAAATAAATDVDAAFTSATSSVLALDPVALLGVRDKQDGATALHLALGEPTYGFGVATALLGYLEAYRTTSASAAAAVADLTSSAATATGETPLHALVCAPNTEDALVAAMVRRLIDLGANVLARNRSGQSAAELAVATRPGRSSSTKAAVQLYETLLTAMATRDVAAVAEPNSDGLAVLHVAIAARNVAAVKALCSACSGATATSPVADGALLARPVVTPSGERITVADFLVRSGASAEMVQALTAASVVTPDEYEAAQRQRAASSAQRGDGADGEGADGGGGDDEEQDDEDAEEERDGGAADSAAGAAAANASSAASLKRRLGGAAGAGGGVSRVQQARKARAATAAQRKAHGGGGRHGLLDGVDGAGHARGLFNGGVSTPVLIVGVLLLVSLLVSGYTMLIDPAAGHEQ